MGGKALVSYERRGLTPELSVVVPVYNVEEYLRQALDSALGQTLGNLEVIAVDDGSTDGCLAILREYERKDPRVKVFTQVNAGQGIARNLGVSHARGEFLTFLDSDDTVPPHAYEYMVRSLRKSGSDFSVGGVRRFRHHEYIRHVWTRTVHASDRIGTTLEEFPNAMQDIIACNRMFKTSFWREKVGDFRGHIAYEDHVPMLTAYVRAAKFDILSEITYNWRIRENLTSTGQQKANLENLMDRIAVKEEAHQLLKAEASDFVYDIWIGRTLEVDFPPFIAHAQGGEDLYRNVLSAVYQTFNARATDRALALVRVYQKVRGHLVAQGRWDDLPAADVYFESVEQIPPTHAANGEIIADLPPDATFIAGLPDTVLQFSPLESHFEGVIEHVEWTSSDLRLTGWAVRRALGIADRHADFRIWLEEQHGEGRLDVSAEPVFLHESNIWSRQLYAASDGGGFIASIPLAELAAASAGRDSTWQVKVEVSYDGITSTGNLLHRVLESSAVRPSGQQLDLAGWPMVASTSWDNSHGFGVAVTAVPLLVESLAIEGRTATGVLQIPEGAKPPQLTLKAPGSDPVRAQITGRSGSTVQFSVPVPALTAAPQESRAFELTAKNAVLLWPAYVADPVGTRSDHSAAWVRSATCTPELVVGLPRFEIDSLNPLEDTLGIALHTDGLTGSQLSQAQLGNARDTLELLDVDSDGDLTRLTFSLLTTRFGSAPRPVPSAIYELSIPLSTGPLFATASRQYAARLPERLYGPVVDLKLGQLREGPVRLTISPPLRQDEVGQVNERRLQEAYRTTEVTPTDSIFFQCYRGEFATDSQLAIDRELARTRPDLTRYWGVADRATEVPEGAVPLIFGSARWYAAIASSRYICNNIDFGEWFRLKPHQRYLQTFHGYPFKSMGIGFWRSKGLSEEEVGRAVDRVNGEWDIILVPSEECADYYREQYSYRGEVLVAGYPRSDFLVNADKAAVRSDVLRRLGVGEDKTVVLYAPTYRDKLTTRKYAATRFDDLDLARLVRTLGEQYVVLVRGHNNNQRELDRVHGVSRVIDVTDYPDINELTVAADVAVLDYSSLRFDWAITGKPMVFFVPDLVGYFALRAPLFAFEGTAPGPWAETTDQVAAALADLPGLTRKYAADIDAFNKRFNALQDGHATERVIDAFFSAPTKAGA
ncbi:MAG: putative glycosyltransferase/glycerophosphotransferase [Marmoricola sp.]|nr:putative glycosyltransferase/glycerophosphotransferase [Marmoricola sp.]